VEQNTEKQVSKTSKHARVLSAFNPWELQTQPKRIYDDNNNNDNNNNKLEIRSVERGICPIATSTMNERTVPIIIAGCMAHAWNGYISTSGLKSDVNIVFLDVDFLTDAEISSIRVHLKQI